MTINAGIGEVISKLEEQVKCPVCLQVTVEPKILQCTHVFCKNCLQGLLSQSSHASGGQLLCPNCRSPTSGFRDPNDLKTAFQTNQLIDMLCDLKKQYQASIEASTAETQEGRTSLEEVSEVCIEHKEPCNLYCRSCKLLICAHCLVEAHKSHDCSTVKAEFESCQADLASEMIKADADTIVAHKVRCFEEEKVMVHSKLDPLEEVFGKVKEAMSGASRERVLLQKHSLLDSIEQHVNLSDDVFFIKTKPVVTFPSSVEALVISLKEFGEVQTLGFPDVSNCLAEGGGLSHGTAGSMSEIFITLRDYYKELCDELPLESIALQLVSDNTGLVVCGIPIKDGLSKYSFSYVPPARGDYTLNLMVCGKHIKGSPFPVHVESSIEKLGSQLYSIDDLESPCGLCFTTKGELVVAENGGQTISILSSSGKKLQSFEALTEAEGSSYCGLAVDKEGNILVVDTINHCVKLFSHDGELMKSAGSIGSGILEFLFPQDVAYNPKDNRFYVTDQNNRVQVLKSDLSFVKIIGKYGNGNSYLSNPQGIACDRHGCLYIADTKNHRVVAFSCQGKIMRQFSNGEDFSPISVDLDSEGNIYVGEIGSRISVFSAQGVFLTSFEVELEVSVLDHRVSCPLSVNSSWLLYICDTLNNKVLLF